MGKFKITAKELRAIGYPESPVIPVAMNVMEKNFKHHTKEYAMEMLKAVLAAPVEYANDVVLAMLSEKQTTHLSKLLSYILRHKLSAYEIVLDENGYTNVDELINKLNAHNQNINFEILQHVVDTNNKKRFAFNDNLTKIRASQGHSVGTDSLLMSL